MIKTMSSKKQPTVSAIIINHNYAQFLRKAIDSVLNQTYPNIELIIVDDGSTDESVNLIQQYKLPASQILLLPEKGGPSRSRNLGINRAKGDYVAFLDSDDYWRIDKVSKQIDFIRQNSLDGAYSVVELLDIEQSTRILSENPKIQFSTFIGSPLGIGGFLMSTLLIHRSVFSASGFFDPDLYHGEDLDFAARIFRDAEIKCLEVPLSTIRRHPSSLSGSFNSKFIFNLLIWTNKFLSSFGKDFSRTQRLKYIYKTFTGTLKICILNKRPKLLFEAILRVALLVRYLR